MFKVTTLLFRKPLSFTSNFYSAFANYPAQNKRGGLMVSALVSGSSGLGSSAGRGHCVVLLTHYSHSASFHPGV